MVVVVVVVVVVVDSSSSSSSSSGRSQLARYMSDNDIPGLVAGLNTLGVHVQCQRVLG